MTVYEEMAHKAFLARNWAEGVAAAQKTDMTNPSLQYYMGWCCLNGCAVPKNEKQAFSWFWKASDQGACAAMAMMGFCYRNGRGVAQNDRKAFEWYNRAALKDSASAKFELARCYESGAGCVASEVKAFRNYREEVGCHRRRVYGGNGTLSRVQSGIARPIP